MQHPRPHDPSGFPNEMDHDLRRAGRAFRRAWPSLFPRVRLRDAALAPQLIERVAYQLDQKCRDVEL